MTRLKAIERGMLVLAFTAGIGGCHASSQELQSSLDSGAAIAAKGQPAGAYFVRALSKAQGNKGTVDIGMAVAVGSTPSRCLLLTARHLVASQADIVVSQWSGTPALHSQHPATLEWTSPALDAALLSFQSDNGCSPSVAANGRPLIGSTFLTYGQPVMNKGVMTRGRVSGYWELEDGRGEHIVGDLTVLPGFSGGGAFTDDGVLIGLVIGTTRSSPGFMYVLPIDRIIDQVKDAMPADWSQHVFRNGPPGANAGKFTVSAPDSSSLPLQQAAAPAAVGAATLPATPRGDTTAAAQGSERRPAAASGEPAPAKDVVSQAQKRLKELGYKQTVLDGVMGKQTAAAVRQFQRDHHLPVTGKLDEDTLSRLGIPNARDTEGARQPQAAAQGGSLPGKRLIPEASTFVSRPPRGEATGCITIKPSENEAFQ